MRIEDMLIDEATKMIDRQSCQECDCALEECECQLSEEDKEDEEEFEKLSGEVEQIILNPTMDPFSSRKQTEMEAFQFMKKALQYRPKNLF